jgi:putative DNA primase/helicase
MPESSGVSGTLTTPSNGKPDGRYLIRPDSPPEIDCESVPEELRRLHHWGIWRREPHKDSGKPTKIPYQSRHPDSKAMPNKIKTWSDFDHAYLAYLTAKLNASGISFVFTDNDPYTGIDLDNCISETGEVQAWALPYLEQLKPGYAEISPSGRGIKIIVRAKLDGQGINRRGIHGEGTAVELYDRNHYFAITGNATEARPVIGDAQAAVTDIYDRVKNWKKPAKPKKGGKIAYGSDSKSD